MRAVLACRHVSEAAAEVICASVLHYLHCSLQHVLVCADRDTNHRHPTFVSMRTSTLSRSEIGPCRFNGSATVFAALTTIPMSSTSRRRKATALTVLAVTPIRPRDIVHVREGFHSFSLKLLFETL